MSLSKCLCTIINDDFLKGGIALIKSFVSNNRWFDGDIVVFHSKKYCILSESSMKELNKLYKNIKYKIVDESQYSAMINHFKGTISQRLVPSAFTYEVFSLSGYDSVLYLDSDMIVIKDIRDIFARNEGIYVTNDGFTNIIVDEYNGIKGDRKLNGGFILIIGKSYVSKRDIIKYSEKYDLKRSDSKFYEQSCMNGYFSDKVLTFLPTKYNMHKRFFPDGKKMDIDDLRIIHYCGRKPWIGFGEPGYSSIEKYWHHQFNLFYF